MSRDREILAPALSPPDAFAADLADLLGGRRDASACHVTARYRRAHLRHESHAELAEPPDEDGAPRELFHELAESLPHRLGASPLVSIPTAPTLPLPQAAGTQLYSKGANVE
jgi:hypothetical protein